MSGTSQQALFISLAITSLVLVQGIAYYGDRQAQEALNWRKHSQQALLAISEVNERKDHTESLVREFVVTGEEGLAARAETSLADIRRSSSQARQLLGDNAEQARQLDRLNRSLAALADQFTRTLIARRKLGTGAATQLIADGTARLLADEAESILDEMTEGERRLLAARTARAERFSVIAPLATRVCSGLTLLFGLLAWRTLRQASKARALADAQKVEAVSQFRALMENAPDAIFINQNGHIVFANPACVRLLGLSGSNALLGRTPFEFVRADFHEKVRERIRELGTGKAVGAMEQVYVRADGTEAPVEVTASPVTYNGQPAIHACVRDITERKHAAEALRLSEGRYRLLFESIDEGFGIIQMLYDAQNQPVDYRFLEISPSFDKQSGLSEARGRRIRELVPQIEEHWIKNFGRVADTGEAVRFQNRAEPLRRWFDVYAFRFGEPASRQVGILFSDITAQKAALAALRDSEENLAVTLQSIGDAVLATDVESRITRLNAVAEKLTGWSQAEALGRPVEEVLHLIHETTREPAPLPIAAALTTGAVQGLANHTVVIARDGTERPIADSCAPIRGRDGSVIGAVLVFRDVTQERAAEMELSRSRAVFQNLFESLPGAFLVLEPNLKVAAVSNRYLEAVMLRREQLLGRGLFEVFPDNPDDPAATGVSNLRASLNRVRQSGLPDTMAIQKYDVRRPDGTFEERYWSPINSPVFGTNHALEYIIHRVEDVTEFVRQKSQPTGSGTDLRTRLEQMEAKIFLNSRELESANRQLYTANIELARASKLKDEFLANMSHELRTPLNAILGLSETLLEQISGPLTPKQVKSVTTISTSGQHLLALINDILDLSKIEAGKLELRTERIRVHDFCQGCLAFVQAQAMQKQIRVACDVAPGLREFLADPKRFKQVLVNLLTNAVKFTPPDGHIGLTVAAPAEESAIHFTVWDTGIGIASADQAKLFQAFTQVDSGLNRTQEGTGLGLALVARLAELHNGSVTLASEPGKGSRFTVTLPWQPPPAPDASTDTAQPGVWSQPSASSGAAGRTAPVAHHFRRALVIEDDQTAAEQLVHYLNSLGLSSAVHPRGEEVITEVLREQPDIILLDLLLPSEDGWRVLARLKEHPQTRAIPVAVVSVVDEPDKSFALGAAAHFIKPVSRDQLAAFLRLPRLHLAPATTTGPALSAPLPGPTILLAEDNEANIQTIGGYLMDLGYDMHYALNGLTAVKLARDLCPALILMDIQMPMMDGLSAIREIRADARLKDIPILALTALAMPGDRERCLSGGATDYMSKPVSLKALRTLIARLLPPAGERESA